MLQVLNMEKENTVGHLRLFAIEHFVIEPHLGGKCMQLATCTLFGIWASHEKENTVATLMWAELFIELFVIELHQKGEMQLAILVQVQLLNLRKSETVGHFDLTQLLQLSFCNSAWPKWAIQISQFDPSTGFEFEPHQNWEIMLGHIDPSIIYSFLQSMPSE